MTPLAAELLRVLESGEVPMASSFPALLRATGYDAPHPGPVDSIEEALAGLIALGSIEVEWRRGRRYYRVVASDASA